MMLLLWWRCNDDADYQHGDDHDNDVDDSVDVDISVDYFVDDDGSSKLIEISARIIR